MELLRLLTFRNSRKVGFGLWLFIVSTALLMQKFIVSGDWVTCIMMSAALLGGGTVADKWLEKKGEEKQNG